MWRFFNKFLHLLWSIFGDNIDGTIDANDVFNWGRSLINSSPPASDFAKGNNVNDGDDGATGGSAICAAGVDDAFFFFVFGGSPADHPPVVLLAFLAALSDGGGLVDASSALLLFPLPFLAITIT